MSSLIQLNEESTIHLKRLLIWMMINLWRRRLWSFDCTKPMVDMHMLGFWFLVICLWSKHSLPTFWRMKTRSFMFYVLQIIHLMVVLAAPCRSVSEGLRSRRSSLCLVGSLPNRRTSKCQCEMHIYICMCSLRILHLFTVRSEQAG